LQTQGASPTPGAEWLSLAADSLERGVVAKEPRAARLLEALDYHLLLSSARKADPKIEVALLRLAARFDAFFQLDAPCAPGLAIFGGVFSPALAGPLHAAAENVSVTGRGITFKAAFEGCVGEAFEYVSQLERDGEPLSRLDENVELDRLDTNSRRELGRWLEASAKTGQPVAWLPASRLSDGRDVNLPADFCLRRPAARRGLEPPFLLGTGAAAGATLEAATLHAVLELIERDALGLWWRGGKRGFAVDAALSEFDLTIGALRRGHCERETWLLDITTDLGAPCIVAISCTPEGTEFAFGAAARPTVAEAARVAILEVCQLELAYDLVRRKARERGEEALNAADRRHLARAGAINAKTCALVRPIAEQRNLQRGPRILREFVAHASRIGVEFYRVDLTRPPQAVPAVRVLAPALQPEPSQILGNRLQDVIEQTGGGDAHTRGAQLL
jgi:ribosomal protein S12 methylthiotransferase accessory factor